MGIRTIGTQPLQKARRSFTVPVTADSYAFERLTFGIVALGTAPLAFTGITALAERSSVVAGATVELWLPRLAAADKSPSQFVDDDYTYSGESFVMSAANPGAETWALAGYEGGQIRVRSGGTSGTAVISATAI